MTPKTSSHNQQTNISLFSYFADTPLFIKAHHAYIHNENLLQLDKKKFLKE